MPKKEDKKSKKNKKGGCDCGKSLFSGGAGGNDVVLTTTKSFSLPAASTITLNNEVNNASRSPFISNGRDNIVGGGKRNAQNKTKKQCVMIPLMIFPVTSKPLKRTKTVKKKGGTSILYDFFLGPSNALTPLTSFGTVSGAVTTTNTLSNNISTTTPHAWSQPIGTKFTATNPIYV
jgi:hypothetical protein